MKKCLLIFLVVFSFTVMSFSQTPQSIPYQAVARNSAGNLLVNQSVGLRFTIRESSGTGTIDYQETQTVTTNNLGLFNVNIGSGTVVTGTFANIPWNNSVAKFTQVEIDPTGGTSYTNMGAAQMMSVPYALYSGSASSVPLTAGSGIAVSGDQVSESLPFTSLTTSGNSGAATISSGVLNIPNHTLAGLGLAAGNGIGISGGTVSESLPFTSLTTTGSSGAATITSGALNIPNYTLAGLGGIGLAALSASAPLSYSAGAFSISQAGTSGNGYLSSTDWNTFNNKVSGTSTQYYVPHWTGTSATTGTLSSTSLIYDNGTDVGIGVSSPSNISNVLHVGAENGQGIDIGNPNDQLNVAGGGSYAIRFYNYRDVTNYGIGAKIAAQRTYVCCNGSGTLPWLEQGMDLVFATNSGLTTGGSAGAPYDNTTEAMRITGSGMVRVADLAGTGYRPVYADASGNLYTISGSSSNKAAFAYSGSVASWTVPAGVNLVFAKIWGGGGGSGYSTGDGPGGGGGFVSGFISVTPGNKLYIVVGAGGAAGANSSGAGSNAFGGGGKAGQAYSGGGGGYSGIFNSSTISQATAIAIAGGGGGGGKNSIGFSGGGGGGLVGAGGCENNAIYNSGTGGNQITGGVTLTNGGAPNYTNSFAGGALSGGNGSTGAQGSPGGGGGWYGGGAGGISGSDGGAGGGSSYISGFVPYMPIRNEQGMTAQTYLKGYTLNINNVLQPGGTDGTDYVSGVGLGGYTVSSGSTGNAGGNGYVVIYY